MKLYIFRLAGVLVAWGAVAQSAFPAEPAIHQNVPAPMKLTIVTASSHCDWAWGNERSWHAERYAQTIHNVLLLMRKYPHYVWQLETVNEQLEPFLKKARREWPGMEDEFWQRVREGRIEVIIAISNPRLNEVYPETIIRNLVLGKQYFRHYAPGIKQPAYHAVDLMAGHSQMPQILAETDYKYFMFSRPRSKRLVFWRTGLDGTRMLCANQHYSYTNLAANGIRLESNCWDDGLPSEKLAEAAETWDRSRKVLATSAQFFAEVEKAGGTLPELCGALDSLESFSCGMGLFGNRNLYAQNNKNEDLLLNAEKAQVMASKLGGKYTPIAMNSLWRDLLSCVGHAIVWSRKADYEERLEKARQTRVAGENALHESLAAVAGSIGFRAKAGSPLLVFNFQGWPVTGPVEFTLEGNAAGVLLKDASGQEVPLQVIETSPSIGSRVAFIASEIPACGYRTYYLAPSDRGQPAVPPVQKGLKSIENEHYRIQLSADGKLQVWDKLRNQSLGAAGGGLGDVVFYDMPPPNDWKMNGPLGQRHDWKVEAESCQFSQGPVFASARVAGRIGPHKIQREVRLWQGSRRIEFNVDIDAADGCGVFFLRCPLEVAGQVAAGIPFGVESRENLDREPFRGEYFALGYPEAYYATRWTDVSTSNFGYTLVAPHGLHNGFAYRPTEQALELALLKVRPVGKEGYAARADPAIAGTGRHYWQAAIIPHAGTWREAATYRNAMELHSPLLAFSPTLGVGRARLGGDGTTSAFGRCQDVASFAEVSPNNVVLSSMRLLGPEDNAGPAEYELRLYETTGKPADVVIRLARPVKRVTATNFLGEPSDVPGTIKAKDKEIRFRIPPWKIVTLRVCDE